MYLFWSHKFKYSYYQAKYIRNLHLAWEVKIIYTKGAMEQPTCIQVHDFTGCEIITSINP